MVQTQNNIVTNIHENTRITRSRLALRTALLDMLEDKSLDQIAIREVAKAAGVGHATFYRHYPTKEALLDDVAEEEIHQLVNLTLPVLDAVNATAACSALCHYVHEYQVLWKTLLTGGAASAMKEELLKISRELVATRPMADRGLPADLGVVLVVSSIVELLAWWLRQEEPLAVTEVAGLLDQIIISPTIDVNPTRQLNTRGG